MYVGVWINLYMIVHIKSLVIGFLFYILYILKDTYNAIIGIMRRKCWCAVNPFFYLIMLSAIVISTGSITLSSMSVEQRYSSNSETLLCWWAISTGVIVLLFSVFKTLDNMTKIEINQQRIAPVGTEPSATDIVAHNRELAGIFGSAIRIQRDAPPTITENLPPAIDVQPPLEMPPLRRIANNTPTTEETPNAPNVTDVRIEIPSPVFMRIEDDPPPTFDEVILLEYASLSRLILPTAPLYAADGSILVNREEPINEKPPMYSQTLQEGERIIIT